MSMNKEEEIEILNFDDDEEVVTKKKKDKKRLRKGEKFFILGNILVILIIIGIYAYRTNHYYKIMNIDIFKTTTLFDKVTNIKNVVYTGNGLYKDENSDNYYFKGSEVDNYVYFEGRLWQIVSINHSIKLISVDNISSLVYGVNEKYDESNIYVWLNDYYQSFSDQDLYFKEDKWCNSAIDVNNYNCQEYLNNKVGLLDIEEYLRAGASNSYLNNNEYWWTINYTEETNAYYVNDKGQINNNVATDDNYLSFGIRPVIYLVKDIAYQSGSGSIDDPYIVGATGSAMLRDNYVGCYVKYNDFDFRVLKIDEEGIELILNGVLETESTYSNLENYLNKEFIKKFNTNDLVKMEYYIGNYNYSNKYDYQEKKIKKNNYIRVPAIGEYFITDYSDYWLNNIYNSGENLYYTILENNTYFSDLKDNSNSVRPIIKVNSDMVIASGIGTMDDPLILGGNDEEN